MDIEKLGAASSKERLAFLRQAINVLEHHEIQILKYEIAEKLATTFDIIGSLPTELVSSIIQYLLPNQICLMRQVSKGWYSIFTSQETCQWALSHWFPAVYRESYLYDFRTEFERMAKANFRFRMGKPAFMTIFQRSLPISINELQYTPSFEISSSPWDLQLDGHYILIVPYSLSPRECFVLNLRANDWIEIHCPQYEQFSLKKLTNGYLVITTLLGRCYVWSLYLRSQIGDFRLPNANVKAIAANQSHVALVVNEEIILWDNKRRIVTRNISLRYVNSLKLILSLQPHGDLLFMGSISGSNGDQHNYHVSSVIFFSIDNGKLIYQHTFNPHERHQIDPDGVKLDWDWLPGGRIPIIQMHLHADSKNTLFITPLSNRITLIHSPQISNLGRFITTSSSACGYSAYAASNQSLKHLYFSKDLSTSQLIAIDEFQVQTSQLPNQVRLVGNSDWLVFVSCRNYGIQGWCFDESLQVLETKK